MQRVYFGSRRQISAVKSRFLLRYFSTITRRFILIFLSILSLAAFLFYIEFPSYGKQRMQHLLCPVLQRPNITPNSSMNSAYHLPNIGFSSENETISNFHYRNYSDFKLLLQSRIAHRLLHHGELPINALFTNPLFIDIPYPSCDGLWLEFGVFRGESICKSANWKAKYCGNSSNPVFGFDSFQGLPVDWRPNYPRGHFSLNSSATSYVPRNVQLVAGWFINTLPSFLQNIDHHYRDCSPPVTYLHVDSDVYDSARDIFYLLGNRLVPGSIIVFDELTNYPTYDKHEMKVLFEYMSSHANFRLRVIGAATPMYLEPTQDIYYQSVAFIVV
ncbi:unnamed protein product [Rotaria socialis]|uniref:Uncharacterized protein n=1 Tax=Rotaria socialis TaxID=392032 RepID=A0A818WZX3_9BILA|nr:unnamed protein product [Rotaria socialis]